MKNSLPGLLYKTFQVLRRIYWRFAGGRSEVVFGDHFRFEPSTHFPSFRGLTFPRHEIFSTIVRYGDYVQTHSAYLFLKELKSPPVIVDVGAHHGIYAVLLGKLVKEKKGIVIAVEPNPDAFKILQENVRLNDLGDTVKCERAAIMERAGSFTITDGEDQSRIEESPLPSGFSVDAITLSSLLHKYSITEVDVLIIDVEGAELSVLRGIDWNRHRIGRIYCEMHPYNWKHFGYSPDEMSGFLAERGFRCFDMYLREHKRFQNEAYTGPTLLIPDREK